MDFLAARSHGRRSGMAEGPRLRRLCQSPTLPQFSREIFHGQSFESSRDIQRRLLEDFAREIAELANWAGPDGSSLLDWILQRFEIENLKWLIRNLLAEAPNEASQSGLISFSQVSMDFQALAAAKTLDELIRRLPRGPLRLSLRTAADLYQDQARPFFFEASLDCAYYTELLARAHALCGEDRQLVLPLIIQETDLFHLMLAVRGRFSFGLEPSALLPFHVSGTQITFRRFREMLNAPDLTALARERAGLLGNQAPEEISAEALERLAWRGLQRLANRVFRRSHMGLAAVVAYVFLRRMEVANLITVSEGIRLGVGEFQIRGHVIENGKSEAANV